MRDQTILCVATRVWDSLWRDSQQIMSRVAAQNRVLYFEPGRNPDRPHLAEMRRNLPRFFDLEARRLHDNLIIIPTPACLPYAGRQLPARLLQLTTPLVAEANAAILARQIRRAMRALDVAAPILWLYEPRHIGLVGALGERLACYYNYDEMAEFPRNARMRRLLQLYDDRLSSRADIVFATSRGQAERRRRLNPNTRFIPNGVDFDLFHRALDPATVTAAEIEQLPRPIIGFVGWLGYQVDGELLLQVAAAYPRASLALVGPDCLPAEASRRLRAMPNVSFLGQQPLERLPAYLKAIDVALIPYRIGGHTLTVYPLKLHEYLAAGRPIVATALPELGPFAEVVSIAPDGRAFVEQIGAALRENTPERVVARVAVARANTWDQRVAMIYDAMERHLAPDRSPKTSMRPLGSPLPL